MKVTNIEYYGDFIKKLITEYPHFVLCVVDGKPSVCEEDQKCEECQYYGKCEKCSIDFIKWLMAEHKEDPVLTAREKGFLECIGGGWISRDSDGALYWSDMEPRRDVKGYWFDCESNYTTLDADYFSFVTCDEKPWTVTDLRKLKVGDQDA